MTQLSVEVLAKQYFLCINRNTWLSQKINLNGITKIPGEEMIECSLGICWNLRAIYSLVISVWRLQPDF